MSQHRKPKNSNNYSKCCPICLAEVKSRHEKRLPCQHILHKKCFERLQSNGHWRCPTCRRPFTSRRSKTCSYEVKTGDVLDDLEDRVASTDNHRRPYWDNLRFLPPLTPPGSDRDERPSRREVDSPRRRSNRRERESPVRRRSERESPVRRRRIHREERDERRRQYREEESKESSDDELYEQVVENLMEEPFFRFFSSNLVHDHEEREGVRWRRSRRLSPERPSRSERRD